METTEARQEAEVRRRRFTAEEYHRMGEAGILRDDERVELIEGEVVEMNPIGGRHAACVRELTWLVTRQLVEEYRVDVQNPVRLNGGWSLSRTWRWCGRRNTVTLSRAPRTFRS